MTPGGREKAQERRENRKEKFSITRTGKQGELEKEILKRDKTLKSLSNRFGRSVTTAGVIDDYLILSSPSGTKFKITVDDLGVLSATEITV